MQIRINANMTKSKKPSNKKTSEIPSHIPSEISEGCEMKI